MFIPHAGCPHRCTFCDQSVITGKSRPLPDRKAFRRHIHRFLSYRGSRRQTTQIAFYGGNFLGLAEGDMTALLSEAEDFISDGMVDSIRFSTRPDTVTDERLDLLDGFSVSTVELGVQSMDDRVLAAVNRGHTALDSALAIRRLKIRNYRQGVQMMIGLPEDSDTRAMETGRRIADLSPSFVRIYPTVVLNKSPLAAAYAHGHYRPLSLDDGVALAKKLYVLFKERSIPVVRMGLQASEDLDDGSSILAGPYHPAFGHLVLSKFFLDMAVSALTSRKPEQDSVRFRVNPRCISRMRGIKNSSIHELKEKFHLKTITVVPDDALPEDGLELENPPLTP